MHLWSCNRGEYNRRARKFRNTENKVEWIQDGETMEFIQKLE